ncbi:MAG: NAD(P)H-binding protein, partial [bacterium]|nr:NAD(P)H-binding protein [bacterium]
DVFVGSLEDAAAMTRAFAGCRAVYAMIPPNPAAARDFRGYQNRVATTLVTAIRNAGVNYVVALSSMGAELSEGNGPVSGLHDFESHLSELATANVLALRPGYFMENQIGSIGLIKSMNILGSPVKADIKVPMIAARDVGAYAARRLLALDFQGYSHVDIFGPQELSMPEVAKVLGEAISKPDLRYVEFSYTDAVNGMVSMGLPREAAESYVELARASNEGRLRHLQPPSPDTTMPTTLEDFSKVFAAVYHSA